MQSDYLIRFCISSFVTRSGLYLIHKRRRNKTTPGAARMSRPLKTLSHRHFGARTDIGLTDTVIDCSKSATAELEARAPE
jgi:hypothetical protein